MEDRQTLRQATKLWQEELDPEFGRSSKNIGAWLQKAKQARQCEPRAVPLHEARADVPPKGGGAVGRRSMRSGGPVRRAPGDARAAKMLHGRRARLN